MYTTHSKATAHKKVAAKVVKASDHKDHHSMGVHHSAKTPQAKTFKTGMKRPSLHMVEKLRRSSM